MITRIQLPVPGIEQIQAEARQEGYNFLETLVAEWLSGENRFEEPGEVLCGCFEEGVVVAIGGLNCDPFLADPTVGRIRRVYVKRAWRHRGIGGDLLETLVSSAHEHFRYVRLRAENLDAARLYERHGFVPIADPNATHALYF